MAETDGRKGRDQRSEASGGGVRAGGGGAGGGGALSGAGLGRGRGGGGSGRGVARLEGGVHHEVGGIRGERAGRGGKRGVGEARLRRGGSGRGVTSSETCREPEGAGRGRPPAEPRPGAASPRVPLAVAAAEAVAAAGRA